MTHVRQTIREAAAAALVDQTGAGGSVFSSLVYPTDATDLPIIHVHVDSEESEQVALGGLLTRQASLIVTAVVDGDERDIDNTLDDYAAAIEAVIGGSTFSAAAKQTVLESTSVERSTEGPRATAAIVLTFAVTYHTDEQDGETAL
jgi:hypothetical protein